MSGVELVTNLRYAFTITEKASLPAMEWLPYESMPTKLLVFVSATQFLCLLTVGLIDSAFSVIVKLREGLYPASVSGVQISSDC